MISLTSVSHPDPRNHVAVIDTGVSDVPELKGKVCSDFFDLTGKGINDVDGHGTNVASIIAKNMPRSDCIFPIKFFHTPEDNAARGPDYQRGVIVAALYLALKYKATHCNMSFGGELNSLDERKMLQRLVNSGTLVTIAAGNEGDNLSTYCNYYPACYNVRGPFVVANYCDGVRVPSSNFGGPVNSQECGKDVLAGGYTMTGTSQAAAVKMNKILKRGRTE